MIVQRRAGTLRLFRQHDHGLASGEMARSWRRAGTSPAASAPVVLATALHDLSWRTADRVPRWNPATLAPYDFLEAPPGQKYRRAARGVAMVARLDRHAAVLVSLHHASFDTATPSFRRGEEVRRRALLAALGDDAPDPSEIRRGLGLLQLFDVLSLHVCLTPPDAGGDAPRWLTGRYGVPGGGQDLTVTWADRDTLRVHPYPFGDVPLRLELPYRDLDAPAYPTAGAMAEAWKEAASEVWRVRLTPA